MSSTTLMSPSEVRPRLVMKDLPPLPLQSFLKTSVDHTAFDITNAVGIQANYDSRTRKLRSTPTMERPQSNLSSESTQQRISSECQTDGFIPIVLEPSTNLERLVSIVVQLDEDISNRLPSANREAYDSAMRAARRMTTGKRRAVTRTSDRDFSVYRSPPTRKSSCVSVPQPEGQRFMSSPATEDQSLNQNEDVRAARLKNANISKHASLDKRQSTRSQLPRLTTDLRSLTPRSAYCHSAPSTTMGFGGELAETPHSGSDLSTRRVTGIRPRLRERHVSEPVSSAPAMAYECEKSPHRFPLKPIGECESTPDISQETASLSRFEPANAHVSETGRSSATWFEGSPPPSLSPNGEYFINETSCWSDDDEDDDDPSDGLYAWKSHIRTRQIKRRVSELLHRTARDRC